MQALYEQLDNPIWHALSGPHAALGHKNSLAAFYDPDVAPFAALREITPQAFAQLGELIGPARVVAFFTPELLALPAHWEVINAEPLEQFICREAIAPRRASSYQALELNRADAPEMLALATATQPGPFASRTGECGRYIGIRAAESGALVAMSGQRLRVPCAVEVSAVCTADSHRGLGLAGMLVHTLAAQALAQDLTPFLHVRPANTSARALYEALGFTLRRTMRLTVARSPAA